MQEATISTSGSTDFNATRNQIIRQAALDVKAISAGITMGSQMLEDFAFRLNAMVKRWQASGIHVWTVTEGVLFLQASQSKYAMSASSTDFVASTYTQTALAADAADSAVTISVDSIADIASGDKIGIVVDDGTLHWDVVNGAPAGSMVTLTTGLDDSASEDAKVFAYTSNIVRPLKVVAARRYNLVNQRETPLVPVARLTYQDRPQKDASGIPSEFFYDPQLSSGYFYIWPVPSAVEDIIKFTWHRPIEDFDAEGDNPDLPQEWISTLIANLANEMKGQFPIPSNRSRELQLAADRTLLDLAGFDREAESVQFAPDEDYLAGGW